MNDFLKELKEWFEYMYDNYKYLALIGSIPIIFFIAIFFPTNGIETIKYALIAIVNALVGIFVINFIYELIRNAIYTRNGKK